MDDIEEGGYVGWLQDNSMLAHAERIAGQFSAVGGVWQIPFATPARPRR